MKKNHYFFDIKRILFAQAGVMVLVGALMLALFGWLEARSALLGGLTALLPNLYFALRIARGQGKEPHDFLRGVYLGESGKIVITAVLFGLIFQLPDILFMPLFAGFGAGLMVFWFALLMRV